MKFMVFCALIVAVQAAHLPITFKTCKHSDGNYQECITKVASDALVILANGDKELGFPKLDPLFVETITIHSEGGAVNLEQNLTNVNVHGFSKSKFTSFNYKIDDKNCEFNFAIDVPRVDMIAPYKAKGKILVLSLSGHGQAKLSLINLIAEFAAKCEVVNGFLNVKEMTANFNPKNVEMDADNLVDGNPELSAEFLKVMNENSLDFFKAVKPDYEATYAEIFKQLANIIFNKIPLVEVLPE